MRPLCWCLALSLSTPALLPAQDAAAPKPQPRPVGRINGTVLCEDTRKPARGATVMISPLPAADGTLPDRQAGTHESIVRTGLDGSFSADHLGPGEYGVLVLFAGYLSGFDDFLTAADMDKRDVQRKTLSKNGIVVVRNAAPQTLNVSLVRGASVTGRVLYSDGSPAAQVSIDLENVASKIKPGASFEDTLNAGRIMRTMFGQGGMSTDDQGRFRIAGIAPGTYRVAAIQSLGGNSGLGRGEDTGIGMMLGAVLDSAALHFYAGDTIHRKTAKTYELRGGDELAITDITIPEHSFHAVSGRLVAAAGRMPTAGHITLTDTADDTLVYSTNPGPDASFSFPAVPSGSYSLAVTDALYEPPYVQPAPGKPESPVTPVSFAPANTAVLVKEGDVPDLLVTMTELPPDAKKPTPTRPDGAEPND